MGSMVGKMKSAKQRRLEEEEAIRTGKMEPREMVTPMLRKALSKQGRYFVLYSGAFGNGVFLSFIER